MLLLNLSLLIDVTFSTPTPDCTHRAGWMTEAASAMTFRVFVAFFSGLIAVITTGLIPFAHFGDKNETWTKRLIAIAFVSAMVFLISLFY
jgi:hypothetical protein